MTPRQEVLFRKKVAPTSTLPKSSSCQSPTTSPSSTSSPQCSSTLAVSSSCQRTYPPMSPPSRPPGFSGTSSLLPSFPPIEHFHPPSLPCLFYLVAGLPEANLSPLLPPASPHFLPANPPTPTALLLLEQNFASSLKLDPRSSPLAYPLPQNLTSRSWPQAQAPAPVEIPQLRQPGPPVFFSLPSGSRFCLCTYKLSPFLSSQFSLRTISDMATPRPSFLPTHPPPASAASLPGHKWLPPPPRLLLPSEQQPDQGARLVSQPPAKHSHIITSAQQDGL